jgi:hypothetical protein
MNREVLVSHVDRQKEISKLSKVAVSNTLKALDLNTIITQRKKAREVFIRAMMKNVDPLFTESLRNGRELLKAKSARPNA